jgi:hypothetical protein
VGGLGDNGGGTVRAKEGRSSFSEEKEAKRLLSGRGARWRPAVHNQWIKVFWFFFSKKNVLAFC